MSTNKAKSEPTTSTTTTHDINTFLNRTSVALARSQRLVDSWLPIAPATSTSTSTSSDKADPIPHTGADNGDDLAALLAQVGRSDKAGLGYVDATAGTGGGTSGRGGESELDRLRKQMLGKKGAKVHLQNQARAQSGRGGGMMGSGGREGGAARGAPLGKRRDREERDDESDDEGGRSAAFKSKKKIKANASGSGGAAAAVVSPVTGQNGVDDTGVSEGSTAITAAVPPAKADVPEVEAAEDSGEEVDEEKTERSSRKPTSYLDEVLSQRKKNKKKKNKNKNKTEPAGNDGAGAVTD